MPPPVLGFKHSPVPRRARSRMVSTEDTSTGTIGMGSMAAIHGVAVTRRASFLLGFAPDDAPLHMQLLLVVLPPPGVLCLNDGEHGATLSGRSEMYGRRRLLSTSSSDEEGGLVMTR
ncbi:hypothetical protein BDZ89DRAFT_1074135 [Hymenopellis radicata]|nr:hypothetical protein BDZ89DRAFT_1074135 [Hymenopellis radicata]